MMYGYGNSMFLFNNGIIATPAANPLWNSLYAVYKAESNANDSLGVYNGTAQGGLTYSTGKDGNAFDGNGTNAYVQLPTASMNIAGDFSVSGWIYSEVSITTGGILPNYYRLSPFTVYYGWSLLLLGNKITFDKFTGINATYERVETTALSVGVWHHIALLYEEGVSATLYVDGALAQSGAVTGTIGYSGNETPTMLGIQAGTGFQYPYQGFQDEFYIWDRLITPTEVTELYNAGAGTYY